MPNHTLKKISNDDWIDLSILIESSCYTNDKLDIFYDWNGTYVSMVESNTKYLLRKALRNVGHKIVKVTSTYSANGQCIMTSYLTTIGKEQGNKMTQLYNQWISETHDEEYPESESESEDEEEEKQEEKQECDDPSM